MPTPPPMRHPHNHTHPQPHCQPLPDAVLDRHTLAHPLTPPQAQFCHCAPPARYLSKRVHATPFSPPTQPRQPTPLQATVYWHRAPSACCISWRTHATPLRDQQTHANPHPTWQPFSPPRASRLLPLQEGSYHASSTPTHPRQPSPLQATVYCHRAPSASCISCRGHATPPRQQHTQADPHTFTGDRLLLPRAN